MNGINDISSGAGFLPSTVFSGYHLWVLFLKTFGEGEIDKDEVELSQMGTSIDLAEMEEFSISDKRLFIFRQKMPQKSYQQHLLPCLIPPQHGSHLNHFPDEMIAVSLPCLQLMLAIGFLAPQQTLAFCRLHAWGFQNAAWLFKNLRKTQG